MPAAIHDTYYGEKTVINQYKYPARLYEAEVHVHAAVVDEYILDIAGAMQRSVEQTRPNTRLLANQPYLTAAVRFKLVDFVMKLSVRLKVVPYVFCRAVRLFDRYCSKRIVLLDQGQLIMATCLWIAAKVHGGNCHFANLRSDRPDAHVTSILDLGYGSGGRFQGPTQRYRLPRVKELIKLCGSRCNYTPKMFNQMEVYIMASLDWNLTEPGVDDYLVSSEELLENGAHREHHDFSRMKQFLVYAACYSYELIQYDALQVAQATLDVINEMYQLADSDPRFQRPSSGLYGDYSVDLASYSAAKRHLVSAVAKAPVYLLDYFGDKGPQQIFFLLTSTHYSRLEGAKPAYSQNYSSPSTLTAPSAPTATLFGDSPLTPRDFVYESVTEIAKSVKQIVESSVGHPDPEEFYPRVCRRNLAGLLTPTVNPANMHSHQYPTILPPTSTFYARNNESQVSMRSSNSSKESEIFDQERPKLGMCTPNSDSGCKNRNGSVPDVPVQVTRKL